MKQLEIVKKAMGLFEKSFINAHNELILIPRFNKFFRLDDVNNSFDFKVKMCEYFSRACSYDLSYSSNSANQKYYKKNYKLFNQVCDTDLDLEDMKVIYRYLGNGCSHALAVEFVGSNFNMDLLEVKE